MSSTSTVDIPTTVLDRLKTLRMDQQRSPARGTKCNAVIIKINKAALTMEVEDEFNGVEFDELQEGQWQAEGVIESESDSDHATHHAHTELEENSPRYVALDYELTHPDGRVSYPLVLVYWCPQTSSTQLSTLYTSALSNLAVQADIGKVVDMREGVFDREALQRR